MKTKQSYLDSLQPGHIVAVKSGTKMISAKVLLVNPNGTVKVQTKNGSIYDISQNDISWVKTGSRWPKGIYNALKQGSPRKENEDEGKIEE